MQKCARYSEVAQPSCLELDEPRRHWRLPGRRRLRARPPNERPQCLELPSPSIPSVLFVQGGVHTLQWSGCQGHVYTGQLSED